MGRGDQRRRHQGERVARRDRDEPTPPSSVRAGSRGGAAGVRGGAAGVQCEPDQRGAAEQHVDADQKADRPGGGSRQTGKDDGSQRQVDNPARQHQAPSPRQLALVIERVHDGGNSLQDEKCDQEQRQRQRSTDRPSDQDSAGGDRQSRREQRPPEARSVAHHEGQDDPDEPPDEKQPAQNDFDRKGGDRRNDYGGGPAGGQKKATQQQQ